MNRKPNQIKNDENEEPNNSKNDETLLTSLAIYFDGHFY